jgi:hypothetical protein
MTSANTARKLRVIEYLARYAADGAPPRRSLPRSSRRRG